MEAAKSSGNPTIRVIVVVAISLYLLVVSGSNFYLFVVPSGRFGYGTNLDGVVTGVTAGSPAAAAGIVVGDRLDTSTMNPQELEDLVQIPGTYAAGVSRTFGLFHDGVRRSVTLVSTPAPLSPNEKLIYIVDFLGTLVCLGVGMLVVLLRPNLATWGFFFFCASSAPVAYDGFFGIVFAPNIQFAQIFNGCLGALGIAGLLLFSLRFLNPTLGGWRQWAQWLTPVIVVVLSAMTFMNIIDTYFLARPAEWLASVRTTVTIALDVLVVVVLLDTSLRQSGADGQRIRWVVVAVVLNRLSSLATAIIATEFANTALWVGAAILLLRSIAPIGVAYAIVRHRVIDINFVFSRTLVYGILTSFFVGLFALIDWFVGHVLDQTKWAVIVEVGLAITVGFWLNGLHSRVDDLVDRVLFRKRHAAERRLARLARGMPHASSADAVDESLIAEPRDALDLTSAALFKRDNSGRFRRSSALDWPAAATTELAANDPLLLHLQAERGPIRLSEVNWSRDSTLSGAARPALAVPVLVRHDLDVIAFFGPHKGGEDFDPDEIQWLNSLAVAAGAAYDHLEADILRRELERVTKESEDRRAALERNGLLSAEPH